MKLVHLTITLLVAAVAVSQVAAQNVTSAWSGEWGAFHRIPPASADEYQGASVSVTDCVGAKCKASIQIERASDAHCEAAGNLQIKSASEAAVDLADFGHQCSITLHQTYAGTPTITAKATGPGCSAYCTPGAALNGVFPLRSRTSFYGDSVEACYAGAKPSRAALCASQALSSLLDQWTQLTVEVSDLDGPPLDQAAEQKKILARCDATPQPANCLSSALKQSMQQLNVRKTAWHTAVTEPGDPQQARQKIAAIAGHYRHSFQNGDIDGDKYTSTDTLHIARASENTIRYSLHLNFYNGHECNRSGIATYKAGGMFVDQTNDPTEAKACFFEIIPAAHGVSLGDPTGVCRESDCGARGGYVNESFSFRQRVKPRH
ncbi:MAG: hypothetical protein ACREWJ_01030 [Rhodoferax sp.]